jgi:hypothetical protein
MVLAWIHTGSFLPTEGGSVARADSDDLRPRVVGALEEGEETQSEVAARFRDGLAMVEASA